MFFFLVLNVKLSQARDSQRGAHHEEPRLPWLVQGLLPHKHIRPARWRLPSPFPHQRPEERCPMGMSGGCGGQGRDQRLGGVRGQLCIGYDRAEEITCLLISFPLFSFFLAKSKINFGKKTILFCRFLLEFFSSPKIFKFSHEGYRY